MKPELSSIFESKYRSKEEIRRQILEFVKGESHTKSDIFYAIRLSYPQIDEHMPWLTAYELLTVKDNTYTITQKGRKYVDALRKAEDILKEAQA